MNLKYMKVSLFEISYKKNELFHDILIYWDASVCMQCNILVKTNTNFYNTTILQYNTAGLFD